MSRFTNLAAVRAAACSVLLTPVLLMMCVITSAQTSRTKASENHPPTVTLVASPKRLCYGGVVKLFADAKDPDGDKLTYKYTTNAGQLVGKGRKVRWGVDQLGYHDVNVEVSDGRGGVASASAFVANSELCKCPALHMEGSVNVVTLRPSATFSLSMNGPADVKPTYSWSVSAGKIISGKGKPTITVDTAGVEVETVTATVKIGGLARECESLKTFTLKHRRTP